MSSRLRQLLCLALTLAVAVGITTVTSSAAWANTYQARTVSISGVPTGVVTGDRITYTVKTSPDNRPITRAGISIKSVGACSYVGYDAATHQVTYDMHYGECVMLFESAAYSAGGVDYGATAGQAVVYTDPHTRRTMAVEGLPSAGVAGDYFTFKAYTVPDNRAVEMVWGGDDVCQLHSINSSTREVTVRLLRNGNCWLVLHTNGDATYTLAHRTIDFTVADPRQVQTIQTSTADQPAFQEWTPLWSSTSGLPLTLTSSTPSTCETNGNLYRPRGLGTCTITARQPGNASWWAAETTRSFRLIDQTRAQTIDLPLAWPYSMGTNATRQLAATSSAGLPIHWRTTTYGCTVDGNGLVTTGNWYSTCTVVAYNDGVPHTWAAAQDSVTFDVVPPYQPPPDPYAQLSFPPISDVLATNPPFGVTATGSMPTTVYTESPEVCTTSGDKGRTITVHRTGTCSLKAIQAQTQYQPAAVKYQSFRVVAAPHFVELDAIGDRVATDAPVTLAATSTDLHSAATGLPVAYSTSTPEVCVTEGDQLAFTGAGTCTVTATAGGTGRWDTALEARSFAVTAATQTLDFPALTDRTLGDDLDLTAAASSGLPVTYTTTSPRTCAVTGRRLITTATGICTVRAAAGNRLWELVTIDRAFEVLAPPPAPDVPTPQPPLPESPVPDPATPGTPAPDVPASVTPTPGTTSPLPTAPQAKAKVTGHKVALTLPAAQPGTTTVIRYAKGNRYPRSSAAGRKLYAGTGTKVTRTLPRGTYRVVVYVVSDSGTTSPPRKLTIRVR